MEFNIINQSAACYKPGTSCCETTLPVAVIGAGPVGLAAAAYLKHRNMPFFVVEAGELAAHVRSWEHVTLFSPWKYNIDSAARILLEQTDWQSPQDDRIPSGRELIELYLAPLAQLLEKQIYTNHRVEAITREGTDRMKSVNRENKPFILHVNTCCGTKQMKASAVIDATGTWDNPNPALSNGVWLTSEKKLTDRIDYHIPDVDENHILYANKRIAVVGGGHSAIHSLLNLVTVKEKYPETVITWILRKSRVEDAYGGGSNDELAARGELGLRIAGYVQKGIVQVETSFYTQAVYEQDGIVLKGENKVLESFDRLIVNTGSRPTFDMHRELRYQADAIAEAVPALAPLIDPSEHSCGSVPPHGEKELRQPEQNFYIVGAKSYGRAPTFLMATGYE